MVFTCFYGDSIGFVVWFRLWLCFLVFSDDFWCIFGLINDRPFKDVFLSFGEVAAVTGIPFGQTCFERPLAENRPSCFTWFCLRFVFLFWALLNSTFWILLGLIFYFF